MNRLELCSIQQKLLSGSAAFCFISLTTECCCRLPTGSIRIFFLVTSFGKTRILMSIIQMRKKISGTMLHTRNINQIHNRSVDRSIDIKKIVDN